MNILLEDTIPFGKDYFHDLGQVRSYDWQSLTPDMLSDIDILALRSTTKVTPQLLKKAQQLKFVTTATAGTNHLDKSYLENHGIAYSSAAGCNAVAVAEYVLSVLLHAHVNGKVDLANTCVGIVGAGNVGTALSNILKTIGVRHLLCDPPQQKAGDPRHFVPLAVIAKCDVISLHVPYVKDGPDATQRLINKAFLDELNSKQILINACRGEVIDEEALLKRVTAPSVPALVLDVFDNEPRINTAIFNQAWFVTPHIAGHSVEGRVRGTQMIYEQVCNVIGVEPNKSLKDFLTPTAPINAVLMSPDSEYLCFDDLAAVFHQVYDISIDDVNTRKALLSLTDDGVHKERETGQQFTALRKQYRVRRECSAYTLRVPQHTSPSIQQTFATLGFQIALY